MVRAIEDEPNSVRVAEAISKLLGTSVNGVPVVAGVLGAGLCFVAVPVALSLLKCLAGHSKILSSSRRGIVSLFAEIEDELFPFL